MSLNLERIDYAVILGGLAVAVIAGFIGEYAQVSNSIELYTRYLVGGAILLSLVFIYRARQAWEGNLARYLEILGAGLAILMVSWIPHIGWHMAGQPEHLGLSAGFWIAFFHILSAITFLIMGYGFYLFWQEG